MFHFQFTDFKQLSERCWRPVADCLRDFSSCVLPLRWACAPRPEDPKSWQKRSPFQTTSWCFIGCTVCCRLETFFSDLDPLVPICPCGLVFLSQPSSCLLILFKIPSCLTCPASWAPTSRQQISKVFTTSHQKPLVCSFLPALLM